MLEAQRRGHGGLRADAPRERAADHVGERREARVEALVLQHALGVLEAADGRADLGEERVGLLGGVVAGVEHRLGCELPVLPIGRPGGSRNCSKV